MAETLETPGYGIFPAWNMDHVCDLWVMVEPWAMTHHAPLCPHWPHAQLKETPVVIWCSESLDSVYFPVQTGQRQQEEKGADSDCSESPNSSKATNMWVNLSPSLSLAKSSIVWGLKCQPRGNVQKHPQAMSSPEAPRSWGRLGQDPVDGPHPLLLGPRPSPHAPHVLFDDPSTLTAGPVSCVMSMSSVVPGHP